MTQAAEAAATYRDDLAGVNQRVLAQLLALWAAIETVDVLASWAELLVDAAAWVIAGQLVAAGLADPYLDEVLDDRTSSGHQVQSQAFAGTTGSGLIESLLYLPAIDARGRIAAGMAPAVALHQAAPWLATYARTAVSDAGRLAVTTGMTARRPATGYYRMLQLPCCARCAILAGKWFAWNRGFARHPNCDCVHIPVQEADDSLLFNPRAAIESGQVKGLSKANTRAIVEYGADPAQVVNAYRRGVTLAGGHRFTTEGITRRDLRTALADPATTARYTTILARGTRFSPALTSHTAMPARPMRPMPDDLVEKAPSRDEAIRLLQAYGYL